MRIVLKKGGKRKGGEEKAKLGTPTQPNHIEGNSVKNQEFLKKNKRNRGNSSCGKRESTTQK